MARRANELTVPAQTRRTALILVLGSVGVAIFAGIAIGYGGIYATAVVLFACLVGVMAWRPVAGPMLLLAVTPLTVGIRRGSVVPFLRLNEALLLAVATALGACIAYRVARGRPIAVSAVRMVPLDWVVLGLVLSGSLVPLLLRFGRQLPIGTDDVAQSFVFMKLSILYIVGRVTIRSSTDVKRCLIVSMAATAPVAALALGQSLQVQAVIDFLQPWLEQPSDEYVGRGAGTIGNSGALADVMAVHLAIAMIALFGVKTTEGSRRSAERQRLILGAAAVVFAAGGIGAGQFSGFIAITLAFTVASVVSGRKKLLLGLPIFGLIGTVALWPVISLRLEGFNNNSGIPPSWVGRLDNINRYFLPQLQTGNNWVFGVRPDTSIDTPDQLIGQTFIESGYLWLLWVGGVFLLMAFLALLVVAYRTCTSALTGADQWLRSAAGATLAATTFIGVLTVLDPHVTLRGISEIFFVLLSISVLAAAAAPVRRTALSVSPHTGPPALGWYRYSGSGRAAKRILDVSVSVMLLILLAPVLLILGLLVRLTSRGPAFFRQPRVGFAEKEFTILKFRSMYVDNTDSDHRAFVQRMLRGEVIRSEAAGDAGGLEEDVAHRYKIFADPRVTPIGKLMRRTSLDELPQLINVLKGDMSLVGPRPSLGYELDEYGSTHRLRALAMPGITGLWQVEGRSDLHMLDALELDLRYVQTCSLRTDLTILAKTASVVAKGSGQ